MFILCWLLVLAHGGHVGRFSICLLVWKSVFAFIWAVQRQSIPSGETGGSAGSCSQTGFSQPLHSGTTSFLRLKKTLLRFVVSGPLRWTRQTFANTLKPAFAAKYPVAACPYNHNNEAKRHREPHFHGKRVDWQGQCRKQNIALKEETKINMFFVCVVGWYSRRSHSMLQVLININISSLYQPHYSAAPLLHDREEKNLRLWC